MNMRRFFSRAATAAMFMAAAFLAGCEVDDDPPLSADATLVAPTSLVGHRFALSNQTGIATMSFLANRRYELARVTGLELGFFSATRSGDIWRVAETTQEGTLTTQYVFDFDSRTNGHVTASVAGQTNRTFAFFETLVVITNTPTTTGGETTTTTSTTSTTTGGTVTNQFAPAVLLTMNVQNQVSAAGPSSYVIRFTGTNAGTFLIELPGYGAGDFTYTPGTNSARLILTYTGDLAGDRDDLNLTFLAASGSSAASVQTGTQRINGQDHPIQGTFTFTGSGQP